MNLFKRKNSENMNFAVQTASGADRSSNEIFRLNNYSGTSVYERRLYKSLRESVPIIDAAIHKIIRLVGGFKAECPDICVQNKLNSFLENVRVNGCETGIDSFAASYLDQLLTYGTSVGEIVLDSDGEDVAALYNSSLDDVEIIVDESPFDVKFCSVENGGKIIPVKYPELILFSAIMPEAGKIYGTSILKGLPFVSDILLKIISAVGTNWERIGNVRFAVTYKPTESDRGFSRERAMQIASEWSKAMKSREPRDFISVGDVGIKVIGADNQIPDSEVPVRQMLEQIVAKLSIPPFLLGLSWSSTERMSSQQADILTSELEYYRRVLNGTIRKICSVYLKIHGISDNFKIVWDNINLQDEVELAKARLYSAQAEEIEKRNERK